ncbi:rhomboid family intramembrane serine protease [Spirochaeta lutea]|uniref:GlpG protein n=1 Tax=Spirochaeta lutea TaxID=1480694 RepID=A0A098QWH4_9SPIO|nr:rhomboid family intramembrane serine protease [Spirochaeta lutea]KGE71896.1 glpG protein [Spirochaeta lutea]
MTGNTIPLYKRPFRFEFRNITLLLIGLNVAVFVIHQFLLRLNIFQDLMGYLAMNPILVTQRGFIWQPFTYMFAHANITHLLFNMLGLFFFGTQLERTLGTWEFLTFYLITGLLAGLLSLVIFLVTGAYGVFLLGASGAVFAVLLGFAVYYPDARIFVFGIFPIRSPVLVIGYTVIELFSQLSNPGSGVAHLTHLAGFAFAYLYLLLRLNRNAFRIWFGQR